VGYDSGTPLMNYFGMGEVAHTALEDAVNTAKLYMKLLDMIEITSSPIVDENI
jgi:DNA polymerase III epsilon subunit-like protein